VSGWRVLGVGACKPGWIGIALSEGMPSAHFAAEIGDLVKEAGGGGPLDVIAADIPIGLPDAGRRQAGVLARKLVGPLWASVFMTPVRPALEAPDYASAAGLSRRLAGEGISRQAFALQPRVLQVDRWVRQAPCRVVEVHPEASFAQLAGAALRSRKSSWAGAALRRQLLAGAGSCRRSHRRGASIDRLCRNPSAAGDPSRTSRSTPARANSAASSRVTWPLGVTLISSSPGRW
jgi:predicted RNase H-like nuclease